MEEKNMQENQIEQACETPQSDLPQNVGECVPAPVKKHKKAKKVWKIIGHIFLAFAIFASGALTFWLSLDKGMRKLIWIKDRIDSDYYQDISNEQFYSTIFDAINDDLLDSYSYYMSADEFEASNQSLAGNKGGIGISLNTATAENEARMLITRVSGNSPAEAAGLCEGDRIVGFCLTEDGIVESQIFSEFSTFLDGLETSQPVLLKILSDGEEKLVTVSKEHYVENYVFYRTNTVSYGFTGKNNTEWKMKDNPLTALPDHVAYIRLTQFGGNVTKGFALAMERFRVDGKKDLILDLRGNTGGYVEDMQNVASYFGKNTTSNKPLALIADEKGKDSNYYARGNYYSEYFQEDSRICVLGDVNTASASECLIGFLLDYGATTYADICLSELSGVAKTFGKGLMQTTYYLDWIEQDAIKITTAEIRWPVSKTSIHGRGVLPEDGTKVAKESYEKEGALLAAIAQLYP